MAWAVMVDRILPKPSEVFAKLIEIAKQGPSEIDLGFSTTVTEPFLKSWLTISRKCSAHDLFPAGPLLAIAIEKPDWQQFAFKFAQSLARPFRTTPENCGVNRYLSVITKLQGLHADNADSETRISVVGLLAHFLRGAVEANLWAKIKTKAGLKLLSKTGSWILASKLGFPCNRMRIVRCSMRSWQTLWDTTSTPGWRLLMRASQLPTRCRRPDSSQPGCVLEPFRKKIQPQAAGILPALLAWKHLTLISRRNCWRYLSRSRSGMSLSPKSIISEIGVSE